METKELQAIYSAKKNSLKNLEDEIKDISMELNFRKETDYDSKEKIEKKDLGNFLSYLSIDKNSYNLYLEKIDWYLKSKKDDEKCNDYYEDIDCLKKLTIIDKKSNIGIEAKKAKELHEKFKEYGFKTNLEKDNLEIFISYENEQGYGSRCHSNKKKIPIFCSMI